LLSAAGAAILCTLSVGALAGAADVGTSKGGQMKFEYRGGDLLRITTDGQDGYMVVRDGEVFMVSNSQGQVMVLSLSQALGMFGAQAGAASPSTVEGKLLALEPTGASETVAGIEGDAYWRVLICGDTGADRNRGVIDRCDRHGHG